MESINSTYQLLEEAKSQPEAELHIPLGFVLDCKKVDYEKHCEEWINKNGGRKENNSIYLKTKEFGGVEREVRMSMFPYFSDPNTETDIVAKIGFIFDEFRKNLDSNGGWEVLRDYIDGKYDDSWATTDFNLADADIDEENKVGSDRHNYKNNYYKYWIRGNMAVEFHYDGLFRYATLEFYNIPKYETNFFKDNVNRTLKIREESKLERERKKKRPKIQNSAWDGSVYQVEKYLIKNLKDPSSYESIEWSSIVEKDGNYQVRHKYRATNSFGDYVIENCIFTLDKEGNVVDVVELP